MARFIIVVLPVSVTCVVYYHSPKSKINLSNYLTLFFADLKLMIGMSTLGTVMCSRMTST